MAGESIRLGVVDQSPVRTGGTAAQAIAETLQLARICERLGFSRYWLAEHHSTNSFACAAPEVLAARVAAVTDRIKVGAGGIMLTHYSPLKIAEQFRMLESLFPGRIDLGLGRAPGGMPQASQALAYGREELGPEHFPQQVRDLMAWLTETSTPRFPFDKVRAVPRVSSAPDVWILSSGTDTTTRLAASLGCGYSFARFISGQDADSSVRDYHYHYRPGTPERPARANVCVGVVCADSEEEAEHLALSSRLWRARIARGKDRGIPSPEEAVREFADAGIPLESLREDPRLITGNPEQVRDAVLRLAESSAVLEILVVTVTHSFEARVRSYERLAQAFGLTGLAPVPTVSQPA